MSTHYGVVAPPFLTSKEPACACADREVLLDLKSGHLISLLLQSSASAISFVLGQKFNFSRFCEHTAGFACSALLVDTHILPHFIQECSKLQVIPSGANSLCTYMLWFV